MRPAFQMTRRRQQILETYREEAKAGVVPTYARLARRCGLYDWRDARRIMNDLKRMGAV